MVVDGHEWTRLARSFPHDPFAIWPARLCWFRCTWVEIWSWDGIYKIGDVQTRNDIFWYHFIQPPNRRHVEPHVANYTESEFSASFKQISKKFFFSTRWFLFFFDAQSQIFRDFRWISIKINEKQRKMIKNQCFSFVFHWFWENPSKICQNLRLRIKKTLKSSYRKKQLFW